MLGARHPPGDGAGALRGSHGSVTRPQASRRRIGELRIMLSGGVIPRPWPSVVPHLRGSVEVVRAPPSPSGRRSVTCPSGSLQRQPPSRVREHSEEPAAADPANLPQIQAAPSP